jgi:hypothetical protein
LTPDGEREREREEREGGGRGEMIGSRRRDWVTTGVMWTGRFRAGGLRAAGGPWGGEKGGDELKGTGGFGPPPGLRVHTYSGYVLGFVSDWIGLVLVLFLLVLFLLLLLLWCIIYKGGMGLWVVLYV